jgi:hypothetical protein
MTPRASPHALGGPRLAPIRPGVLAPSRWAVSLLAIQVGVVGAYLIGSNLDRPRTAARRIGCELAPSGALSESSNNQWITPLVRLLCSYVIAMGSSIRRRLARDEAALAQCSECGAPIARAPRARGPPADRCPACRLVRVRAKDRARKWAERDHPPACEYDRLDYYRRPVGTGCGKRHRRVPVQVPAQRIFGTNNYTPAHVKLVPVHRCTTKYPDTVRQLKTRADFIEQQRTYALLAAIRRRASRRARMARLRASRGE